MSRSIPLFIFRRALASAPGRSYALMACSTACAKRWHSARAESPAGILRRATTSGFMHAGKGRQTLPFLWQRAHARQLPPGRATQTFGPVMVHSPGPIPLALLAADSWLSGAGTNTLSNVALAQRTHVFKISFHKQDRRRARGLPLPEWQDPRRFPLTRRKLHPLFQGDEKASTAFGRGRGAQIHLGYKSPGTTRRGGAGDHPMEPYIRTQLTPPKDD